ncbi:FtsX-like permease family protein [Kitasatospora xanthocidica]|uniref:FtsX-like permease family protein n=1 Tax=Kitasatospora xanthocidica TaxID=83382 RepID=UPI0036E4B556
MELTVVAGITDDSTTASAPLTTDTGRAHDPSALTPSSTRAPPTPVGRLVRILLVILIDMWLGYTCLYTCLAIADTLLMATAERAAGFAVLRLSGATRRQVPGVVAAESALSVGIGTALGLAVALVTLAGLRSRIALDLPWSATALTLGVCLALAPAAGGLPARLALRRTGARAGG